jgi:hypothetical protein
LKQWKGLPKLFTYGIGVSNPGENPILDSLLYSYDAYSNFEESDSPFDTSLPSTGIVFLILFAHMILAVPVNLLYLRSIGKGEIAWVTTPIICVAFAAIFFALAAGLYGTGKAVRTRGVLVVSSLRDEGYFQGMTELFIPKGGTYDIGLQNVESVGGETDSYYVYAGNTPEIEVVDDGEVHMDALRVSNLAFRSFALTQRVDTTGWIKGSVRRNPSTGEINCKITNESPHDIENAHLYVGEKKFPINTIESGKTFDKVLKQNWSASEYGNWVGSAAVMVGDLAGMRLGATIGEDSGSQIRLVYVWEDFK